jgi:hypothetical protein
MSGAHHSSPLTVPEIFKRCGLPEMEFGWDLLQAFVGTLRETVRTDLQRRS